MGKSDATLRKIFLFFAATALLIAGWTMKSFPILIFAGVAPLFAIADESGQNTPWGSSELILAALAIGVFSAHLFELNFLAGAIAQAIVLTLAFVARSYVGQQSTFLSGTFTVIVFWLGIEYLFLKLPFRGSIKFLADAVELNRQWLGWNRPLGYLGASLWILMCNFFVYLALFKKDQKWRGLFIVLTLISVAGPIFASPYAGTESIKRSEMISVYQGTGSDGDGYLQRGELAARVAAIGSALILIWTFVTNQIQKSK